MMRQGGLRRTIGLSRKRAADKQENTQRNRIGTQTTTTSQPIKSRMVPIEWLDTQSTENWIRKPNTSICEPDGFEMLGSIDDEEPNFVSLDSQMSRLENRRRVFVPSEDTPVAVPSAASSQSCNDLFQREPSEQENVEPPPQDDSGDNMEKKDSGLGSLTVSDNSTQEIPPRGRRRRRNVVDPAEPLSDSSTPGISRRIVAVEYLKHYTNPTVWVQCDRPECRKWRRLNDCEDVAIMNDTYWICSDNEDPRYNSCDKPEEESYDPCVLSMFSRGSIVMAKVSGYDYCPAMVDDDPDLGVFFWPMDWQNPPEKYHVVFLCDPVCRSWVSSERIRPFEDGDEKRVNKDTSEKVLKLAKSLLKVPIKERLDKWSFASRFTGKWGLTGDPLFK